MWDEFGNYYTPPASGQIDWGQLFSEGIQTVGGILTDGRLVPGYDARYRGGAPVYRQTGIYQSYNSQPQCDGIRIGGEVSAGGGGTHGGVCLSKTVLIVMGIAGAFFLFGQKRGRG